MLRGGSSMIFLTLLLGLVQGGDTLGLEAPKGWKRQEDPQKRFVQYTPPKIPAGGDCTLLVYPPTEYAGTAENFLDAMVGSMTQGKRALEPVQKLDIGIFRAALIAQQNQAGLQEYLAVHAVKVGTKIHAVLYGANGFELFKQNTMEVFTMLKKAAAPGAAPAAPSAPAAPAPAAAAAEGGVAIHGLNLPLPGGWSQQKDPGTGWVQLIPPDFLFPGNQKVFVLPTQKIQGLHWAAHR